MRFCTTQNAENKGTGKYKGRIIIKRFSIDSNNQSKNDQQKEDFKDHEEDALKSYSEVTYVDEDLDEYDQQESA